MVKVMSRYGSPSKGTSFLVDGTPGWFFSFLPVLIVVVVVVFDDEDTHPAGAIHHSWCKLKVLQSPLSGSSPAEKNAIFFYGCSSVVL